MTGMRLPPRTSLGLALPVIAVLAVGCGPSDARVAANVTSELKADPITASSPINVTVSKGVTHLSGHADTNKARERAADLAESVRGVTGVVNDIRISDATLEMQVRQALAADAVVGKIPIQVQSTNGAVSLVSDKTNQDERTRIVQIARAVPGVVSVEDNMK